MNTGITVIRNEEQQAVRLGEFLLPPSLATSTAVEKDFLHFTVRASADRDGIRFIFPFTEGDQADQDLATASLQRTTALLGQIGRTN